MLPTIVFVLVVFIFGVALTIWTSFTSSGLVPNNTMVGNKQFVRLFNTEIWNIALTNMAVFTGIFVTLCLTFGFLLAALLDQITRFRTLLIATFLFPSALSFIVAGIAWKWLLNPTSGLQSYLDAWEIDWVHVNWLAHQETALYAIIVAAIWQSAGITMIVIYSGLLGINEDLWRATRVDGIPAWRVYLHIAPGEIWPAILSALVILSIHAIKTYELVVVLTDGGPGVATEMPTKFIFDMMFVRSNIGQASAAATVVFLVVLIVITPLVLNASRRGIRKKTHARD